jgi:cell division protein FtsB
MLPSSNTSAARTAREARSQQAPVAPSQVVPRLPISKVGWDRKFRMVMVLSFVLVGWIGLKAGIALFSARAQASQESSLISSLKAQHRSLLAREKALHQPATIMRDARGLGMVRAGERSFVIVGPSSH